MTIVKRMIDSPVFGIFIKSSKLKIPFITKPRSLAIGPKNQLSFWVKSTVVKNYRAFLSADRIIPALGKRIATQNPPKCQYPAL
jgi:hypothetical protein